MSTEVYISVLVSETNTSTLAALKEKPGVGTSQIFTELNRWFAQDQIPSQLSLVPVVDANI